MCDLTMTGLGNINIWCYMVAVYINGHGRNKYGIINDYQGNNYQKGLGNIKLMCIKLY